MDSDIAVVFCQWQTTNRSTIYIQTASLEEYKDLVISSINSLTAYSFIAKAQTNYLKCKKENLEKNEAIILGEFAEN